MSHDTPQAARHAHAALLQPPTTAPAAAIAAADPDAAADAAGPDKEQGTAAADRMRKWLKKPAVRWLTAWPQPLRAWLKTKHAAPTLPARTMALTKFS
jgi:hypothetical protein